MLLSLIIPSLNTKGHLEAMLSSLEKHRPTAPHEVIVVDMSSSDGTLEMLASRFPESRVLRDVPNRGYGAACNVGIAEAKGTHIMVCNSDLIFREGTIDNVAATLEEVGVTNSGSDTLLGFRLEGLDGVMQRSALHFPSRIDLMWMFSVIVRGSWKLAFRLGGYMADYDITERTPVDWVTGAAMAAPRSLWDKLNGFDEQFFLFCEEIDLCRRIHQLGGTVLYVPDIAITHVGGGTLDNASDLRIRWIAAGKVRYTRKHHGQLVLFVARSGATAAYLTSYPVWLLQWLRRGITGAEFRREARRWGEALLEAWRV